MKAMVKYSRSLECRINFYVHTFVKNVLPSVSSGEILFKETKKEYLDSMINLYHNLCDRGIKVLSPWDLFQYFMPYPVNQRFHELRFPDWRIINEISEGGETRAVLIQV